MFKAIVGSVMATSATTGIGLQLTMGVVGLGLMIVSAVNIHRNRRYNMQVHFIGFTNSQQFHSACRVFGKPDFVHRRWDVRARQEVQSNDVAVFAKGCDRDVPQHPSFDDSCHF